MYDENDLRSDWDDDEDDSGSFDAFLREEGISQDEYDAMTMAEQDALLLDWGWSMSSEEHDRELGPLLDDLL